MSPKTYLTALFQTAVTAVRGDVSVQAALRQSDTPPPTQIIAVGKAAAPMAAAALDYFDSNIPTLVITKHGHLEGLPAHVTAIEAAHPVPDQSSLIAGQQLIELVEGLSGDSRLLMLVSGGASSLAEHPKTEMSLQEIAAFNEQLVASGLDIHAMNQ